MQVGSQTLETGSQTLETATPVPATAAGVAARAATEAGAEAGGGAGEEEEEEEAERGAAGGSLLSSPVPASWIDSLGLSALAPRGEGDAAAAAAAAAAAVAAAAVAAGTVPAVMTSAAPPGYAASVMTYNALVTVLQRQVDARLESLLAQIDKQALAARREMILTQLTPQAIALNCLTDLLENKVAPMRDIQTRLGPRVRDIELDYAYKQRLWLVHDRLQDDFKFRMLFVPSYVREKWREKKEAIRAASLDVRAVATQRRRRAKAADADSADSHTSQGEGDVVDEEAASRASRAWEELKARARLQRNGASSRTLTRTSETHSEVTRFPVKESRPAASAGSQTLLNERAGEGRATVGVGGAGGVGAGEEEVLAESEGGGGRAKGSEGALPVSESMPVSDALPVSESMSLAEIRDFIRKESLEASVKTSGSGKTS